MDGHGHAQDQCLSGPAGRQTHGHAALQPDLPQGTGIDRMAVPVEHGQVHVPSRSRKSRSRQRSRVTRRSRTSTARPIRSRSSVRRTRVPASPSNRPTSPHLRFSVDVRHWRPSGRRQRPELPPRQEPGRLLPDAGQPGHQANHRQTDPEDRGVRGRPIGQHERQEDRAGQRGTQIRTQQSQPGRPVQHHRLRQSRREFQAGTAALRRPDACRGVGICRRHLCRRQHEHRRCLAGSV